MSSPWNIADDWSSLSSEDTSGGNTNKASEFSADMMAPLEAAAKAIEEEERNQRLLRKDEPVSKEESFVYDAIDTILNDSGDPSDPALYDTVSSFDEFTQTIHFTDKAAEEISLLVRCNESPETILVESGRALAELTEEKRHDVSQLISMEGQNKEVTLFFNESVASIFNEHSVPLSMDKSTVGSEEERILDRVSVAKWMTKCLQADEDKVGEHDKRVTAVISRYGTYKSGYLTHEQFRMLYLDAVLAGILVNNRQHQLKHTNRGIAFGKNQKLKQPTLDSVWRDFRMHDIVSPAEQEHDTLQKEIDEKISVSALAAAKNQQRHIVNLMDECEILEWKEDASAPQWQKDTVYEGDAGARKRRMSHELIQLASDNATPMRIRDGQFVFIDEESCIGCTQCAQIAPSSFTMLESGRARSFQQSNSPEVPIAVSACPVNCMHHVAYHELVEMETSRDVGDGRTDHRHMGNGIAHTPLHVGGIGSDANHKSSWYHYLKQKCCMSSSCPSRGCYDCPHYDGKGNNPFFKKRQREAQKVRVMELLQSGEADLYRKTAEL
eukprot:CAMPEP_0195525448 /NCGR_PEP_ID=MMETSP0794_2-20130614/25923_1 /TAXON_ID=515487 /ORGANISM="Stephanopyxis turris, Strain CCMP 815" /LENGTH=552 /DNA_ID=CAMNT_0040655921 /DNA_START=167 /DNA_END=1825 /DNA_ORIENTATION=-